MITCSHVGVLQIDQWVNGSWVIHCFSVDVDRMWIMDHSGVVCVDVELHACMHACMHACALSWAWSCMHVPPAGCGAACMCHQEGVTWIVELFWVACQQAVCRETCLSCCKKGRGGSVMETPM